LHRSEINLFAECGNIFDRSLSNLPNVNKRCQGLANLLVNVGRMLAKCVTKLFVPACLLACFLFVLANKSLVKNLRGDHYLWGLLQCPPKSVAVFFSCGYQSHMYSTSFSLGTTQSLRGGKKSMKLKKHASKIQAKRTWKFMSTGLTTKNTG